VTPGVSFVSSRKSWNRVGEALWLSMVLAILSPVRNFLHPAAVLIAMLAHPKEDG
jgi:hypothetical protein